MIDQDRLMSALDRTWPAARVIRSGQWVLRQGNGGGQRVCAATAADPNCLDAVGDAETEMRTMGQEPLFQIRPIVDAKLDKALEMRGYAIRDAVHFYHSQPQALIAPTSVPVVNIWPPLAIVKTIWADAGIGTGRLNVMARARGPKTALLARKGNRPAGAAFVAIDQDVAMIHAIEVPHHARRQGAGADILRAAAAWALDHDATTLSLAVTRANVAANALYASLGMSSLGGYHYRVAQ